MPTDRNVLFITVDQWRGDALSCAGHPVVETPHLDRLAAEGTRFARHYAQAAPCGPSRASLHTGQYLMNHRSVLNGTPLDSRFTNLAIEARSRGYDPVLFGYTDTSADPRTCDDPADPRLLSYEGVLPGFREGLVIGDDGGPWRRWLADLGYEVPERPGDIYRPDPAFDRAAADRGSTWAPTVFPAEHSISAFLTDAVIDGLAGATPGWFAHVSYIRPHPPWRATREYHDRYDPADVPAPRRLATWTDEAARHPFLGGALALEFVRAPADEREQRQTQATYHALMNEVDDQLGRLFGWLRDTGRWDDTLVVVTADHGEELGDHWLTGKLGWFDGSYHVPMIVRDPRAGAVPGQVVDAFTEHVDVMPTILDWIGIDDLPVQCDGRSLLPFVAGEEPPDWRQEAHWEFDFRIPQHPHPLGMRMEQACLAVVRTRDHKYVHFPTLPPVLHDLVADPDELVDRSTDPAYAPVMLDLAQRMLDWRMEHAERTLTGLMLTPGGVFEGRDRLR